MAAAILTASGVAVLLGTFFAVLLTRTQPLPEPEPDDPWMLLSPRAMEDVDRPRVRVRPIIASCAGLALIAAGISVLERPAEEEDIAADAAAPEPTPEPFRIDVSVSALATPEPEPTPEATPEATAAPAPQTVSTPGAPQAGPDGGSTPTASTPAPTPPPSPPGPSINASASCSRGSLHVSYSVTAREGTTLTSLRIARDGTTVWEPPASGQHQHSGSFQTNASPGSHQVAVIAHGSDGGVTQQNHPVTCN